MAEPPPEVLEAAAQARAAFIAPGGDMTSPLNAYFQEHPEQMTEILMTQSEGFIEHDDIIVLMGSTWSIVNSTCYQRTCRVAACYTCALFRTFVHDPDERADVLQQHAERPEGSYSVVGERLDKDGKREVFYAQFHLE
jgi:hypothetical protein